MKPMFSGMSFASHRQKSMDADSGRHDDNDVAGIPTANRYTALGTVSSTCGEGIRDRPSNSLSLPNFLCRVLSADCGDSASALLAFSTPTPLTSRKRSLFQRGNI
ncbi:hypothetical protein [Lonsdalea quercina]|uniref:hypothetical protein n=1 Tax=Lonsdalea quercina TaxID=71657 RepID=UPI003974F44E